MTQHGTTKITGRAKPAAARIPGRATETGTRGFAERFAARFSPDFYRDTSFGLITSSLGMGTYLGECDDAEDNRYSVVIEAGIERGVNVVDTAINYRCQRSERAVGRALQHLLAEGSTTRDEIVICTKGGYIPLDGTPPASREEYAALINSEYIAPGLVEKNDIVAGGHCLKPRFLANQIDRSRSNMGIDCIDVFYIHNPEQQLDILDRAAFLAIMREAFVELESQVTRGHIASYGCATWNGFRVFAANRNYLSLVELETLANEVGGTSHHFRALQLPVNLAMTEAVRAPAQHANGKNVDVITLAGTLGISVVASAALMQAQLTRDLPAAVKSLYPSFDTDAQRAIAFVRSLPLATALVGMRSIPHLDENLAGCAASA